MPQQPARTRIAVDIGGTFTDVVLDRDGALSTSKVLTTPDAPERGVLEAIEIVLDASETTPDDIDLILHGTTLATNAIIERKGAVTALVTTGGFRDVLDIGYESRYDQYDLMIEKPKPLVPRARRLTVPERVDVNGRVLLPLDEDAVRSLVPELDQLGVESIAVGFLHAYANPDHERRVQAILADLLPKVSVTLSSEVCPEVREFERLTTASANAYVLPAMSRYLGQMKEQIDGRGFHCPLLLMTSGGGLTTLETARRFPIRLVESGPAGGAILAGQTAAAAGLDKVVSFDMGGTTAKICLIEDQQPRKAREFEIDRAARFQKGSGLPLRIPVIEMVEIGAGGGSIARLDALGRITIGPDSAGANPGPASYDQGGERPTITDADIVLGRIDPARFAGGKLTLSPGKGAAAIDRDIGGPLGLETKMAAYGITEMVDETMANAARVHAVEQGRVASQHTIIAFGGAAPLHATRLAEKLGIDTIIVPNNAGVGSAVGFLAAPVAYEVVRSRNMRLNRFDAETVSQLYEDMRREALAVVRAGAPDADITEHRSAYMRYVGQGHEILVPVPLHPLTAADAVALGEAYDREYAALFQRTIPNADVEVLTWGLTIATVEQPQSRLPDAPAAETPPPTGSRRVFDVDQERETEVPLYWRPDLGPGMQLTGPALIAEDETSTFLSTQFNASIAANGDLVLKRTPEPAE